MDITKLYKRKHFPFFGKINWLGTFDVDALNREMELAQQLMKDLAWKDLEQTGIYHNLCDQHDTLHTLFKSGERFKKENPEARPYDQYQQFSLTEYDKEKYGVSSPDRLDKASKNKIKRYRKNILTEASNDPNWVPEEDERCYNKPRSFTDQLPYTMSVLNAFKSPIGRTRYARLHAGGQILPHIDYDTNYALRFHIALKTNPDSFLKVRRNEKSPWKSFHIPVDGYVYWLNTGYQHTAINNGNETRWHLLIGTNGQEDIMPLWNE